MERPIFDAPFEESFDACGFKPWGEPPCDSRRRIARAQLRANGTAERVGFVCARGHKLNWETGGLWIPIDEFGPNGRHSDLFPPGIIALKPKRRQVTFDIKDTMQYRHRTAKACAACDAPNATNYNLQELGNWLRRHRQGFFMSVLRDAVEEYFKEKSVYDDGWYQALDSRQRAMIMKEVEDSRLQADHGIARDILEAIGPELSSDERDVARGAFTFPLCAKCNRGRRAHLDEIEVLAKRWAKVQGISVDVAVSLPTWRHIASLYQKAHRYRTRAAEKAGDGG